MCVIPRNLMRACQEPECKQTFTRKHTWDNVHYCPQHRSDTSELDRPGQCVVQPTINRTQTIASTGAGFMERFMQ